MLKKIVTALLFLIIVMTSSAQSSVRTVERSKLIWLEQRLLIDNETTIDLIDSLYTSYSDSAFVIIEFPQKTTNGLVYIYNRYSYINRSSLKSNQRAHVLQRLDAIQDQLKEVGIHVDFRAEEDYQRLITKAESYFLKRKYEEAFHLYSQIVQIRPTDEKAQARLNEIIKLILPQEKL